MKKFMAIIMVLALVVCLFPMAAFADVTQENALNVRASFPNYVFFKDHNGNSYPVNTDVLVSQGSSWTGYVTVIQEVLYRMYQYTGNSNFNPNGIDGSFGNGTRLAVVSYQVYYLGANAGDGVLGNVTWSQLYSHWESPLGRPSLTHV